MEGVRHYEAKEPVPPRTGQASRAQQARQDADRLEEAALITSTRALVLLGCALVLARFAASLSIDAHLGVDGGPYIVGAKSLIGAVESDNSSFARLPLGPGWSLVPFLVTLGDNVGYKLWSAIFSVVPLFPAVYLLAQRILPRPWAVTAGFVATAGWLTQEMHVTGALPLIGFGYIILAMWAVDGLTSDPHRRHAVVLALMLPALAFTNHTTAGLGAITLAVWTLALLYERRRTMPLAAGVVLVGVPALIGILLSLTAWPWYPQVGLGSDIYRYPGPLLFIRWTVFDIGWYVAPAAFGTAYLAVRQHRAGYAVLLILFGLLAPFYSFDETVVNLTYRSRFLASILMVPVWAVALRSVWGKIPDWRWGVAVPLVAFWIFGSAVTFVSQVRFSTFVNPDVEAVLSVVTAGSTGGALLTSNFGEGTWYQGLTGLPVYYTFAHEPPRAFTESEADVRCVFGWVDGCNPDAAATRLDAEYVVVNRHWPADWGGGIYGAPGDGRDSSVLWPYLDRAPWLDPVAESGKVKAWRIERS